MINWLIDQQLVVSVTLLILLLLEGKALKSLGANSVYALWLLVPAMLLANNLPQNTIVLNNTSVYRYVVELGAQPSNMSLSFSWGIIWALGCTCILLLSMFSQWKIHQLSVSSIATTIKHFSPPKGLTLRTSKLLSGPILTGVIKPTLLIPENFQTDFSLKQQHLMLSHELVHHRRKDNLFNLLALVFIAVFWFNPIAWAAYRAFRRNQELACDSTVLKQSKHQDKVSYSQALVQCAEHSLHSFSIYSPYGEKNSMLKRLSLIQTQKKIKPSLIGLSIAISSLLVTGVAIANLAEVQVKKTASSLLDKPTRTDLADKSKKAAKVDEASPIYRIEPRYPIQAAQDNQEGSVILEFDITKDGSTDNIKVVEAFPQKTFEKESINALKEWKYKPRIQGGKAQRQTGLLVQLDFRMDKPYEGQSAMTSKVEKIRVSH